MRGQSNDKIRDIIDKTYRLAFKFSDIAFGFELIDFENDKSVFDSKDFFYNLWKE